MPGPHTIAGGSERTASEFCGATHVHAARIGGDVHIFERCSLPVSKNRHGLTAGGREVDFDALHGQAARCGPIGGVNQKAHSGTAQLSALNR